MLDGNLWQEQTTASTVRDKQAMSPDLDLFCGNWHERRKHTERNLSLHRFREGQRSKTGIVECCAPCGLNHSAVQRRDRGRISHAAAQFSLPIQSRKPSAQLGKMLPSFKRKNLAPSEHGQNSRVRNIKQ